MCDTTILATTYGAGRAVLRKALKERLDFKTGGALRGACNPSKSLPSVGRLNSLERVILAQDVNWYGVTYVVWSYDTPIAWVRGDKSVHYVGQKFSTITSKHQGMLYPMG